MLQEQLSPYFVCSCGYRYVETGKNCPYYFFLFVVVDIDI